MKLNKLTEEEKRVIEGKGTEAPYSGEFDIAKILSKIDFFQIFLKFFRRNF